MFRITIVLIFTIVIGASAKDRGGNFDACRKGQTEVARKAVDYHGERRIAQLIRADLVRAKKEEAEGDADECIEALDHANKLIAGQY